MTDKERYEAAMEENNRLREELKDWKAAFDLLLKDNKQKQDQILQLGNKIVELSLKLTGASIKLADCAMMANMHEVKIVQDQQQKIATAEALQEFREYQETTKKPAVD